MPTRALLHAWLFRSLRVAGWAPVSLFAVHVVLAWGFAAYRRAPPVDIPMHLLGGVAIAHFFRRAAVVGEELGVLGRPSAFARGLLVLAATGTAAVVWEFAEWTSDRMGWSAAQLSLQDTLLDMACGLAGGAALLLSRRRPRRRPIPGTEADR